MPAQSSAHARLAELMNKRRIERRMLWDEIAESAEISTAHLRKIRTGEAKASELTEANIEAALKWERGSIERILRGGDPVVSDEVAQPAARMDADRNHASPALEQLLAAVQQELAQLRGEVRQQRDKIEELTEALQAPAREDGDSHQGLTA